MANTLTGLYPIMYNAMNIVSREMVGFIPAVSRDATAEMAAANQTVRSPVVGSMAASNITPTNIAASGTDQTIDYVDITINNQRKVTFNLTGEEERGLGSSNNATIATQRFAQAFRTLGNEIETDLAETYVAASRAYGTAGTTPFGTGDDLTDLSEALRILDDNGAPKSDRHVVLGSAAVAKLLGKQPALFKINEAGDDLARRFGMISDTFGAMMHHSGQVQLHTSGTVAASPDYLVDQPSSPTGYSIGDTTIHLDTGSGTHVAGDVISFVGDTNKYVITTGSASSGDKDIVLGAPGLRLSLADGVASTIAANYTANMAFSRDAIQLAARVPALPTGGDQADDRTYVEDPVSGLVFEVAVYRQYRQVTYEVAICWGVKPVKPEHLALLMG
jgi:hypothetical protein